jgi:hypothetical protein
MMAVKDRADGTLLTAADLNELSTSMNMCFATAQARDAYLTGTRAPTPGMTVCMLDTNLTLMYVVVNTVGYWAPLPMTPCFFAQQAATQALAATTYVAVTNWTVANHGSRNYSNWFSTSTGKFTPKVPGLYEFVGGLSMTSAPVGPSFTHRGGFRLNGTGNTTYIVASENRLIVTVNGPVGFNLRRFVCAMNGTTDYMELVAYAAAATNTGTTTQAPVFGAKYVGQ